MLRVTLKGVRSHMLRFLLTTVAVTLGVALVAGTFVLTDSINKTFDDIITTGNRGVDVQVRGPASDSKDVNGDQLRRPLPLTLQPALAKVDGVTRASPDIQGSVVLVGSKGTAVRNGGAPTLAYAYHPDDPVAKVVKGRGPQNIHEVAVESTTLKLSALRVGDRTKALVGSHPEEVTIVGQVDLGESIAGATLVLVDEKTAIAEFAPDGTVPSFSLTAASGVSQSALAQRVSAVLPAGDEAVTGKVVENEQKKQFHTLLGFISTFLLIFAAISLFVGGFIIANTFSMLVAQRTRELALLRAIGASRAQVVRTVLGEAFVLGLFGSVIGIVVGAVLAGGLKALFGTFGLQISGGLPVHPRTIVASLLVGTVVTTVSSILPAVRASRIAPVAALRDDTAVPVGGVLRRGIVGALFVVAGAALLVPGVGGSTVHWPLVGLAAGLLVIGALVAAPTATRPVVRVVAAPFVLVAGTVGRLARENALRNPRRTATTASALMIGLALMAGVSVIAASTKASVSGLVRSQLTADYVLNGGSTLQFPTSVAQTVAKLPQVASVAELGFLSLSVDDHSISSTAATGQGIADNIKVQVQQGSLGALGDDRILVSRSAAKDHGWKLGSDVTAGIGTLTGQHLTVAGIYQDNQILGSDTVVSQDLYLKAFPPVQRGDYLVYVKAKPGTDKAALRDELNATVKPFLVVSVQDGKEFTNSQASQINQVLYIIYALLALSVVIAVLGIINTLALSVFERTREIGLLRAVGMSRRQLRRMITVESVSTAVFGAVLGMALGLALGLAVVHGERGEGLGTVSIPWGSLVAVLVASAIAGVIAAVLPAWRAVRLDVLRAVTAD